MKLAVGVVQMNSQSDVDANLTRARALSADAAKSGARLIVLPENFAFMGEEDDKRRIAEDLGKGPISAALAGIAKENDAFVIGGGMPEKSGDSSRPYNTSALFSPRGEVVASYKKVHLFDVELADGTTLKESNATCAGEPGNLSVTSVLGVAVGMTICYDVRFPEAYRKLVDLGAQLVTVPSAFTLTTGKDHWHVLLRARAIEDQVYVAAAAQHGKHPRGRQTYGKSIIVDPWGDVLAQAGEGEGFAVAQIDLDYLARVRASLPSLKHRKLA